MHGVPPNLQPQTQDQVGSLGASAQGSDPQEIGSQQQLRPQKAQVTLPPPNTHSVICPTTRCPPVRPHSTPGWAPTPNLSQLKALPGSETLHDPYPRAAKPQLLSCHSRSLPTRPGSSLHASRSPGALCPAWSRLPTRCPSAPDTPSPPAVTCPNLLSFKAQCQGHLLQAFSPLSPAHPWAAIYPACLAVSHLGRVCLPPWNGS